MNNKLNFVFCFDENYLTQAEVAIFSLLECVSEEIIVDIIYPKINNSDIFNEKIYNHKNLNKLNVHYFDEEKYLFPNIQNTHVSAATYYRFFIEKYIDNDSDFIIYLDTDIVCIKDPIVKIREEIVNLKKTNYLLGACLENEFSNDLEVFQRLKMNSDYFNAGFLIINIKQWKEEEIGKKLLKLMHEIKEEIVLWDQDVINSFINGSFLQVSKYLNFCTSTNHDYRKNYKNILNDTIFFHYSGKIKPWHIRGSDSKFSEFYHSNYRKIYTKKYYHLKNRNRKLDTVNLFTLLYTLKIFELDYPQKFLKESIKTIYLQKKLV